jgi:hypothetical protein
MIDWRFFALIVTSLLQAIQDEFPEQLVQHIVNGCRRGGDRKRVETQCSTGKERKRKRGTPRVGTPTSAKEKQSLP